MSAQQIPAVRNVCDASHGRLHGLRRGVPCKHRRNRVGVSNQNAPCKTAGVRKAVNPPYGLAHTEDLFMSNLQTCRTSDFSKQEAAAGPQRAAALAA